jgi:hypothetical protein
MPSPPTLDQLQALKLTTLAAAWPAQQQEASCTPLSFDEPFALLVEAEWRARVGVRLTYPLPVATLQGSRVWVEGIEDPGRRVGHGRHPLLPISGSRRILNKPITGRMNMSALRPSRTVPCLLEELRALDGPRAAEAIEHGHAY